MKKSKKNLLAKKSRLLKRVAVGSILLVIGFFALFSLYGMTIYYCEKGIREGFDNRYITFKLPIFYNVGEKIRVSPMALSERWKQFLFGDFWIQAPYKHPRFALLPWTSQVNKKVQYGLSLKERNANDLFRIVFMPHKSFKIVYDTHELFRLPVVMNFLKSIPKQQVIEDLFSRNLDEYYKKSSMSATLRKIFRTSYFDYIYDLFILVQRDLLLKKQEGTLSYNEMSGVGIQSYKSGDRIYELWNYVRGETVYSLKVQYKERNASKVKPILHGMLASVKLVTDQPKSVEAIYNDYLKLSYRDRIDEAGFFYLYSAWTQDITQTNYLEQAVLYLERGGENAHILIPLYKFLNLNREEVLASLKEQEKLQDRMKKEDQQEDDELLKSPTDVNDNFTNNKDRMKFILQKIKEEGDEKKKKNILYLE